MNNTDYFIEPIEEFDSSTYENNEFSFVDFELSDWPLGSPKTHIIYTKSSDLNASSILASPSMSSTPASSCALDDSNTG